MLDGIAGFVADNQEQGLGISLSDYLQDASLATDFDRNTAEKDADCVNMMTIHSAKGLEFPFVFIAGLEEGLFPSELSAESPRELEEERRLFYVALTRAERQVILTFAKSRFRNGKMEFSSPSRFIKEIPEQYRTPRPSLGGENTQRVIPRIEQRMKPLRPQMITPVRPLMAKDAHSGGAMFNGQSSMFNGIRVGCSVVHERFGRGVVQALEGTGLDAKATVQFENAGTKVLMLRFAKLTVQ